MVIQRVNTRIEPGLGRSEPLQTPKFIRLFEGGIFKKKSPVREINTPQPASPPESLPQLDHYQPHQHNALYYQQVKEKIIAHQQRTKECQTEDPQKEEFYREASKELVGLLIETQGGKILHKLIAEGAVGALSRIT